MLDRREVLGAGVLGSILPLGALASAAEAGQPLAIHRAIYDRRFDSGRAFAVKAAQRGWTTAAIDGDVTDLWYRDLDLRWKQGPAPIAGVTTPEALFVLDHLARGAGMRVISSEPTAHERTVSWLIAPTARAVRA
jgi:hypothetical protein